MTIKSRLTITLGMLCIALVAMGALGVNGLRQTVRSLESVYNDRVVSLEQIKGMSDAYAVDIVNTAHKTLNGTILFAKAVENVDRARNTIRERWTAYRAAGLVEEEKQLVGRIDPLLGVADQAVGELREILERQDRDALTEFALNRMYPAIDPVAELLDQLAHVQLAIAKQEYEHGASLYRALVITTIVVTSAAVLVAGLVGLLLIRAITRPLDHAVRVARRVADGDLAVRIESGAKDETGQLLDALRKMRDDLAETVNAIQAAAELVGDGSREIARGNADLSSRTEEQASSLEETASSMEALASTSKQSAEHARQASQLAVGASDVAARGGEVVREVVSTMKGISDSSRKIADITAVIDGIAFQTNILALNAAVEAARAGEQGRGFAVVASEVRSLAQRSATAAKEIKALIEDSAGQVQSGTRLVDGAGRTMEEIVSSVKRVADIITEISAASQEQLSGIEQMNGAVAQMDRVVQQNAALVEQSAAAAENLASQAEVLNQTAGRFRLGEARNRALAGPTRETEPAADSPQTLSASRQAARLEHQPSAGSEWQEF
jgi:methyl-accepting chemotaxis protein/methyl-accepting chemotaxis protein-1 (serine sensor receptor)